ncbi:MAG: patatin-like phospholipase family protein [Lachnospira eligens]
MKTGIVFEGGAFRTIFSCGVMDAMLENKIMPDYMIGVSAGAAYGVSMASGQIGRNLKILIDYRNDKRYVGLSNMVHRDNRSFKGLISHLTPFQTNLCLMIMMLFTDIRVLSNVL